MALTLLEASKYNSGDVVRAAVIKMFAENSQLMSVLPWENIPGGALAYTQEGKLPGVAFRGFNEGYDESVGVINPQVETLRIAGGDLDCDLALLKTRGEGIRSEVESQKVKALTLNITGKIINGDSATNPREFDGLRVRISGSQLIPANLASPSANGPLSLESLDAAIDAVDNPTHLIMSKGMRRKLTNAARGGVGGDITYVQDELGRRVTQYNDLPIVIADYDDEGQYIIGFDEAGPAGGSSSTSIYVVNFGSGYVVGLQNGVMDVRDLGEIDAKPVLRTRVEWLVGLAVMHGRSVARVWGITNSAVVA